MPPSSAPDAVLTALARSLLTRNLNVRPGETVTIEAWPHTLPLAVALSREARRRRALPILLYEDETAYWDAVDAGQASVLGTAAAHEWAALGKTDVYLHMWGPGDRVRLNALPAPKSAALFRSNDRWYATARKAGLRGLRLEYGRPFPSLAAAYGVDEATWRARIVAASGVDPRVLARRAAALVRSLATGRRLRLTHPNGTDLTLGLARRPVRVYDGRPLPADPKRPFDLLSNVPAGAVRLALDETVADGTLVGNRTCYYEDGVARGARFEFAGGKLVRHAFESGGERFDAPYARGGVGRDRPGFLSIGMNPELRDTPQVEDLESGAVMVSLGANQNLGGKNRASFFGWGIVAGGAVEVDGAPLKIPD